MNSCINNVSKNKKRKILVYSNDEAAKNVLFKTISEKFKILNKKERENREITFEFSHNKKSRAIKLTDSLNLDPNISSNIDYSYIYRKKKKIIKVNFLPLKIIIQFYYILFLFLFSVLVGSSKQNLLLFFLLHFDLEIFKRPKGLFNIKTFNNYDLPRKEVKIAILLYKTYLLFDNIFLFTFTSNFDHNF